MSSTGTAGYQTATCTAKQTSVAHGATTGVSDMNCTTCNNRSEALVKALDTLVIVVGLTAFKYEAQRAALQEAVDLAKAALKAERQNP